MSSIFPDLKYPPIDVRIKKTPQHVMVFDAIRKKWLVLSPEEWVRQHLIHWLIQHKGIASSLISIEKEIKVNGLRKRYDAVIYNTELKPLVLIECKAPDVPLNTQTIEQALRYNLQLNAPFCFVSNGLSDALFKVSEQGIQRLEEWPMF